MTRYIIYVHCLRIKIHRVSVVEPRLSHIGGKCSTTELLSTASFSYEKRLSGSVSGP